MAIKKPHRPHIHKEGRNSIILLTLVLLTINVVAYLYVPHWLLAITLLVASMLLIFVTYFFRNPVRIVDIDDPNLLIAPADGRVVVIEPTTENEYFHDERLQVSIFMSPFNVHANWYPIEGKILMSEHQKGRHKGAWLPKSSTENERSLVVIETADKQKIAVRQVAGAMARRIVTYAKPGMMAERNRHLGFIKLGSRVDLYLPIDTEIFVEVGDLVRGNETLLGQITGAESKTEEQNNTCSNK